MSTVRAIEPAEFPWYDYRGFTFSLGLETEGHVYNSGHSGSAFDPVKGKPDVAGGLAEQTRVAYDKQLAVLAAAGLDARHVTRVVENVTIAGLEHYAEAEQVRRQVFGEYRPVVLTVIVDRLVRRKALIEVEVHASPAAGPPLGPVHDLAGRWYRTVLRTGHDGAVYLPTVVPVDADGSVVAPGDEAGQYEFCLQRAGDLLAAAGLGLDHVASIVKYTSAAATGAHLDRVRDSLFGPVRPAEADIVMTTLHERDVRVALDVVATSHAPVRVDPGWAAWADRSPGVLAGGTLYLSGLTALDPDDGSPVGAGDLRVQAEHVYDAIAQVMRAGGADQLLSTVEYVLPEALPEYRAVADVRREQLREPYPVSTGIVCAGLPNATALIAVAPTALVTGTH